MVQGGAWLCFVCYLLALFKSTITIGCMYLVK